MVQFRGAKMDREEQLKKQHWTRNPMVWLVIFFPALAVVAGIITILIAANTEDGLVVDDYYKQGLQINQVLSHDKKAKTLGLSAFVDVNTQTGQVLVSLNAKQAFEAHDEITVKLIHRTRSGQDQITVLSRKGNSNDYLGYLKPPIIAGRWTLQILSQQEWRLKQNFTTKNADHILLNITP